MKPLLQFTQTFERIFVFSPHMDDAVLSCGSFLLSRTSEKIPVTIINVASGDPGPIQKNESKVLSMLSQLGGHDLAHPRVRRQEDLKAVQQIGCKIIHLGFLDAAYRQNPKTKKLIYADRVLGLELPRPEDDAYLQALQLTLDALTSNMGKTLILAPMGIGGHVDHVIVRNIARTLESKNRKILFYEDFPYVIHEGIDEAQNLKTQNTAVQHLGADLHEGYFHKVDLKTKFPLVMKYKTQIKMLFGTHDRLKRDLISRVINKKPSEVFWSLK